MTHRQGREQRSIPQGWHADVLDRISDGFVVLDADWNYTYVNPRAAGFLGRDDLVGKNYWDEFPEAAGSPFAEAYRRSLEQRVPIVMEDRFEPWDRWFENRITPTDDGGIAIYFTEITERKLLERNLREREQQLRLATESGRIGTWSWDADTGHAEWSPTMLAVWGVDRALPFADPAFTSTVHADDRDEALAWVARLVEGREADRELRIVHPDGTTRWVRVHGAPEPLGSGATPRRHGVVLDRTDERRARVEREELARQFRELVDHVDLLGVLLNERGEVTFANAALLRALGRSLDQIVGMDWFDGFVPPSGQHARDGFHAAMRDGALDLHYENEIETSGGEHRLIAWSNTVLTGPDGRPVGTASLGEDITERRRQEEQRESLEGLIQASADFIGLCDLDLRLTFLNRAGRRLVGLAPDADVTQLTAHDFVSDEVRATTLADEIRSIRESGSWDGETELRHLRTGATIPVQASSFLVTNPSTGEPFALATIRRDLRGRQRSLQERARLARERRLLLDRLVGAQEEERARVARELHDELGPLLTSVGLMSERLERDDLSTLDREQLRALRDRITSTVGEMRNLVWSLRPRELDDGLGAAVERLADRTAADHDIRVEVEDRLAGVRVAPSTEVTVFRVIQEAFTNVIRHSEAKAVSLVLDVRDDRLVVVVDDDGIGFDPATRTEGSGLLGMRERARLIGGDLTIEAAAGRGTTVRLEVER